MADPSWRNSLHVAPDGDEDFSGLKDTMSSKEKAFNRLTEPNYSSGFRPVLMLISGKYVRNRIRRIIKNCPSLNTLDDATVSDIAEQVVTYAKALRWFAVLTAIIYILFASVVLHFPEGNLATFTLVNFAAASVLLIVVVILSNIFLRPRYEQLAALRLIGAVRVIDMNEPHWQDLRFRWNVAKLIERSARAIESIPAGGVGIAPYIRRELFEMSRRKAQVVRELELSVVTPESATRSRVAEQLASTLSSIGGGQWHKLPEAEYRRTQSRVLTAIKIVCALLALAGAIVLVALASRIGSSATLVAPILVAVAAGLLNAAGVPLNVIEIYKTAAESATTEQKNSGSG